MTIHRIRLSKMQKVINVLAVASAAVSVAVVGSVGYVYVNRTAILEEIKEKAIESIMPGGGLPTGGGALTGDVGVDFSPAAPTLDAPQAKSPQAFN